MDKYCSFILCENLDRAAIWVGSNMASAFFASLERCSCINLGTTDFEDDDINIDEAHERPLMLSKPIISDPEPEPEPEPEPNPNPNPIIAASD